MTRQFCREKRGKNGNISGKIPHCVGGIFYLLEIVEVLKM